MNKYDKIKYFKYKVKQYHYICHGTSAVQDLLVYNEIIIDLK